jgi:hypothetical protein
MVLLAAAVGPTWADDPAAKTAAAGPATPDATPGANQASVASPAGTLGVASVKLSNGWRASKTVGAAVYNDQNQKIGSVDDLILTQQDKVVVAVIAVGGFLGIGAKLVAVPFSQLRVDGDHMVLAGATKDALNGLPAFTYGNG